MSHQTTHHHQDPLAGDLAGAAPALCADCYAATYGYEPEMGDQESWFRPGTCDACGSARGVVFTLDIG